MSKRDESSESGSPGIKTYLQQIARYKQLTPDEEKVLGAKALKGNKKAIKTLVEANLRFVVHFAKRYRNLGLSYQDLINEGNLGLMEAAKRFDPERGVKFITYAVWWVRQSILHALAEQGRALRLPQKQVNMQIRLSRSERTLTKELGRKPNKDELAEDLGLSLAELEDLLLHRGEEVSLDAVVDPEHDFQLSDKLEQTIIPSQVDSLMEKTLSSNLVSLLSTLGEKERYILTRRFGLDNQDSATLKEIGAEIGLSRERVRQIEVQALRKLRRNQRAQHLRGYLN